MRAIEIRISDGERGRHTIHGDADRIAVRRCANYIESPTAAGQQQLIPACRKRDAQELHILVLDVSASEAGKFSLLHLRPAGLHTRLRWRGSWPPSPRQKS